MIGCMLMRETAAVDFDADEAVVYPDEEFYAEDF
jgi:hypothetical protein